MIRLQNIHKSFGATQVLHGIDLHVKKGETLVIVGPSGTGKSVTLQHTLGLLHPDEGEVLIDGADLSSAKGKELKRLRDKFGVLFQSGALINWLSVGDNIALPLMERTKLRDKEIAEKVNHVLTLVGMEGVENKMPSEISGGMKKRAGLARAIVTDPEIILYDEPTSGLDPVLSRKIDKLITDLKRKLKITSIVVTHDMISAFAMADKIAMLHGGKVIEEGTVKEFRNSTNPIVQEFIQAQFGDVDYHK